ncbi:MAG: class I SAM-dependent methyltransferase [Alphaproteobacteria bacterium]|nr:class I SAM-dependent methyltransferase [Alphaproteobacteria bacterium]
MHIDVADLRDFYASRLGAVVRRLVSSRIQSRWRRIPGGTLMGLGYAVPYLGAYRSQVVRCGALMPSRQGALVWPREGAKQSVLIDDEHLPLPDNSVDRMLVVHGLETAERVQPVLREVWRTLAPEGRLMMVVPNRRGIWARTDRTPFGYGRPYSRSQLEGMLRDAMFEPIDWTEALYAPPFSRDMLLSSAVAWERIGARLMPGFAGVIIVEAAKELVAPIAKPKKSPVLQEIIKVAPGQIARPASRHQRDGDGGRGGAGD